jgi:dienelactone hydrolase
MSGHRKASTSACAALAALAVWVCCDTAWSQPAAPAVSADGSAAAPLAAELHETVVTLPVTVQPMFDDARTGDMLLTHFKPDGDGPFPAVVMQHGRSVTDRANPGRFRFLNIARYWQRRGVAVFVPTRLGYGDTGLSPDPEETGPCNNKRYGPAAEATAVQTLAAIEFARQQPWVDKNKVIVMGQSVGGLATVVAMGKAHSAVVAGINFAGGAGGDPIARRGDPCSASEIGRLFANAAKSNAGRTPMLWPRTAAPVASGLRSRRRQGRIGHVPARRCRRPHTHRHGHAILAPGGRQVHRLTRHPDAPL